MSERGPEGREGQVGREGVAGREGVPGIEGEQGEPGETGAQGAQGERGDLIPAQVRAAFIAITLAFVLILTGLGLVIRENRGLAEDGAEAHDTLCAIRLNNQAQYDRTQDILDQNPGDPVVVFGLEIPRAELERSQRDRLRVLTEMKRLDCVPPPPPLSTVTNKE